MTIPAADLTTTHLDAGADVPANARVELKAAVDKINAIINDLGAGNIVWTNANDGASSGLDSDLLDGQHGTHYLDLANSTGTLSSSKVQTSGLDSDLLDGQHGTHYLARANHTGSQAQSTITNLVTDLAAKLTQTTNLSSGSAIGAKGYFQFGNFLFNVGSVQSSETVVVSETFSLAFTALINITTSPWDQTNDYTYKIHNASNSGFDITQSSADGGAPLIHYCAIGWKT